MHMTVCLQKISQNETAEVYQQKKINITETSDIHSCSHTDPDKI